MLTERNFATVEAISAFAAERGVSLLQVAIGGLAAQPAVASVIAGAMSPAQLLANAEAAEWTPTAEDLRTLDEISPTRRPERS
jgi:aryl-alcohol dehydrogenase-like predicted oxidoreductase